MLNVPRAAHVRISYVQAFFRESVTASAKPNQVSVLHEGCAQDICKLVLHLALWRSDDISVSK
jgi:hypothetical protein